jgi:hypothetical protein
VHEPVTVADLFDVNDATISELQMLEVHLPAGTAASLLDSVGQVSCRVACVITTVLCANRCMYRALMNTTLSLCFCNVITFP